MNFIVLGPFLCIFGLWTDFVSSESVWKWGAYFAIALTVVSVGVIFWGFTVGLVKSAPGFRFSGRNKLFAVLVIPSIVFCIWWMLVVRVLPDIYTRIAGTAVEITSPMNAIYRSSRRSCDYTLKGPALDRAFPAYLCTSSSAFAVFPSDVVVTLQGKQSSLGMHIQHAFEAKSTNKAFKADVADATRP